MTPLNHWNPCLADDERGIAFFDLRPISEVSIRIESDPITEPRWDRVLPILEEEQVFMCRMMAPLLQQRKGLRVLDIGTGSGVFAICAAKLGCRVTAIDISPRAIRFARHNAAFNNVPVTNADQSPSPGEIRLQHMDFRELQDSGEYDVVILAPPYNPTCPGVLPALHASAGVLGQDCLLEQLPFAAKQLKTGGTCIGNQMILADRNGKPLWESDLRTSFPDGKAAFKRIITQDRPVGDFLLSQYSTFLDPKQELCPSAADVTSYIERHSKDHRFALIYFEITKATQPSASLGERSIEVREIVDGALPPQSWKERELLHRRIIEHTAQEHSFPAPALFLEVDALPDFPARDVAQSQGGWRTSSLSYVDSWLAKTRLLHPETGLFDLVLVDTAPWYPSRAKRASLPQECAVWMNNCSLHEDDEHASEHLLKSALKEYQKNTLRQQKRRVGPFLHPVFTGAQTPCEWRPVHFSTLGEEYGAAPNQPDPSWIRASKTAGEVAACELTDDDEKRIDFIGKQIATEESKTNCVRLARVYSNLEQLEVPAGDIASYKEELSKRIQLINTASTESEKVLIDFNDCHLSMHLRLREIFDPLSSPSSERVSHLVGLPVSIASTDTAHEIRTLPESYRGGVWVYVESSRWSPVHERYLLDLIRILSMLYEDQYTKMSAAELRLISADASRFNWSHETKHIIVALRRWPAKVVEGATTLPYGMGSPAENVPQDVAIMPFASLFDAGMAHLQAWTMAASASDLPFCGEDCSLWPNDIKALAQSALNAAQDAFLIRLFRKFPVQASSFDELSGFLDEIRTLMPKLSIETNPEGSLPVDLDKRFWQDFARLLLCEFREMLQHALWADGCKFVVSHDGDSTRRVEFRNTKASTREEWIKNLKSLRLPKISYFDLGAVYDAFKNPVFSSQHSKGDGDRERANLAEALGARIEYPITDPGNFSIVYSFNARLQ
jgi:SAM-dependent methyltransferase